MSDEEDTSREAAHEALDRAHLAAAAADGGKLRRALEEAAGELEGLSGQDPSLREAAEKVRAALADLDSGKLVELETLLEQARRILVG